LTASPSLVLRLVGHMLIDRMPDAGLVEMVRGLVSVQHFYVARQHHVPALLAMKSVPAQVKAVERPKFEFEASGEAG
jgi:hypothetical protein